MQQYLQSIIDVPSKWSSFLHLALTHYLKLLLVVLHPPYYKTSNTSDWLWSFRLSRVMCLHAQEIKEKCRNKSRNDVSFELGDLVLIKLKKYRQESIAQSKVEEIQTTTRSHKFECCFFCLFEIVEKIGAMVYDIKLPISTKIHDVFMFFS